MSFIKNILGKKEESIKNYTEFWNWFQANEKTFFNVVKSHKNIEKSFFDKLSDKLSQLKDGYFFLTGMYDDNTVELVLTADGNTSNIVFVEELVAHAPQINGWKFTAFKPAMDIENVSIEMAGYKFDSENLFFYSNDYPDYPDEIDISIIHNDLTDDNRNQIINGVYIFLDNYLGELDFVNNIDNLKIISKKEAEKELIPISKLKAFITWRQKEFIEKYNDIHYSTERNEYSILEAKLDNDNGLIAVVNSDLLNWNDKASLPWIAIIIFNYDGEKTNGMPDEDDYEKLGEIEDSLLLQLSNEKGCLYIGRQTANSDKEIYFVCKDFREPSKVFFKIQQEYKDRFKVEYEIYKDKYWQSFERFRIQ